MAEASVGDQTWTAMAKAGVDHGGGTSEDDIKAYAQIGAGAAATAACAATGYGAVVASACGAVGSLVAGAVVEIGAAIFGSDAPNINDTWNPRLDKIMHKLSDSFPDVPWEKVKGTFAQAVNAATMRRRMDWSRVGSDNQKRATRAMGADLWLYALGKNTGYIDEATQAKFWANSIYGQFDYKALGADVVVGATNAAVALSPKKQPPSEGGLVAATVTLGAIAAAVWKRKEIAAFVRRRSKRR